MIAAELKALRAAINGVGLPTSIGQVAPGTHPPYVALAGAWDPERAALADDGTTIDGDVLMTVTHTNENNVHEAVRRIAAELTPDFQPSRLPVAGRYAVVEWLGMEGRVRIDRDVTYGKTNQHPAYAAVSLHITSQPL